MTSPLVFSADPDRYPDPTGRAERVCQFIEHLTLWEGVAAGQRFPLRSWQRAIVRRIYGPTTESGRRLVRTACLWLPRGNGKTTLAAALSLAHFLGPEAEPGGQIVQAAADQENAGIAFNMCWQMIQQSPRLMARVRSMESRKKLTNTANASTIRAISSEAYSKHGLNASLFLADEIHSWPAAEGRKLFGVVSDSMVKREQPLTIIISTAGEGQNSKAWDMWSYSLKVASGEIDDPSFAPIFFAADPKADWQDEGVWRTANPALADGFASLDELRTKVRRVVHFPGEVADFKRFNLNIWQDGAGDPWVDMALYDAAPAPRTADELTGKPCWIGIDLSSTTDLTAVVAVFPDDEGGVDVLARFFVPEEGIKRRAAVDGVLYPVWAEQGWITPIPGNVVDHGVVARAVADMVARYDVRECPMDRALSGGIVGMFEELNVPAIEFGQGFLSMSPAVKALEMAILGKRFRHGGNPVLRWCFENVVAVKDDAESVKFSKRRSIGRIDGAVAAAMAIGRAVAGTPANALQVYETDRPDGILFL